MFALFAPSAVAATVYVDGRVGSSGDGASWATAMKTIQEGIDTAAGSGGGEVWVVKGTYLEAITMKSNVLLYGGFLGTETDLPERNPPSNVTTIDGSTARVGLPAYHVVVMDGTITTGTIRLDGFTITGGVADGPGSWETNGGGILCVSFTATSAAIANCTISGNSAYQGGGAYCYQASPTITNCTISGNSAGYGSGVYCVSASPTIANCMIGGNSADVNGGGVYCANSASPAIANCRISGNSAGSDGGGVSCESASSPTITNCRISGNSAPLGGGVYCVSASPAITDCWISGNPASFYGGGVACWSGSSPAITNCTISGNSASYYGGGVACSSSSSPAITNCAISGNSAGSEGSGVYCEGNSLPAITFSLFFSNPNDDYFDSVRGLSYTGAAAINANVPGAQGNIDGDPMFVMDGPKGIRGTWTAAPVYDHTTSRTLLTDSNASFKPGALPGWFINADTGEYLQSYITSNTLTQIEVFGDVTAFAASGDSYKVSDYHLREGSSCIAAGDNNPPGGLPKTDMDGDPRIVFDTVDIGADEFDPPPCVTEAVCNDSNNNGTIEPGESLTLIMNRAVHLMNLNSASSFYLPVAGDSLGGAGFGVILSPQNSRHITVTLGAGANLTVGGAFDMANLTAGSPSGVDIAANLTSGTILSLTGKNAVDGGVEGVNDSGRDVFFTCVAKSTTLGASGGTAQVLVSPNAAYTQHALIIPAGALSADQTITLRPPENNGGVLGAVQIDAGAAGGGGGGASGGIKIKAGESRAGVSPAESGAGEKQGTGTGGYSLGGKPGTGTGGYSLAGASPRFSAGASPRFSVSVSSVSSVVENLPTFSQAGTPALPSQAGTPALPSQTGTPALPSQAGTPALPSQAGTPALPSQAGTPALPSQTGTHALLSQARTPVLPSQTGTPVPLSDFAVPVELEIEYRESDVDREQGEVEAAMEVHQLVENPAGVFTWRQIPGDHHVDPARNTVKVAVMDLNPCGSIGAIRVFAVLPAWTIEPIRTHVRPQAGGGGVRIVAGPLRQSGADASPGETGDYRLHQIDIPNYVVTTEDDPERITVEIWQPALLHRSSGVGTFFPVRSCAIFAVKTTDASGAAVEFTSPVNVRVQFMDGTKNAYFDLVDFHGVAGAAFQMRAVHDTFAGPGVDFAFLGPEIRQALNTRTGTVGAFGVTCLTDATGEGVWGAVVDPGVKLAAARCWEIYE